MSRKARLAALEAKVSGGQPSEEERHRRLQEMLAPAMRMFAAAARGDWVRPERSDLPPEHKEHEKEWS